MRQLGAEVVHTDGRRLRYLPSARAQEGDRVEIRAQDGWYDVGIWTRHLQDSGLYAFRLVASLPMDGVAHIRPIYDEADDPRFVDMIEIHEERP